MANESALFEDDFPLDLEDDTGAQGASEGTDQEAIDPDLDVSGNADEMTSVHDVDLPDPDGGERPIPAISMRVFYEVDNTANLIETIALDRRMRSVDVEAIQGGLTAAIEYLQENVTPNLLVLESHLPAAQMIEQIDALAEHCDPGVQVMVIGATNDIALYRQLVSRGVSEYLVPPVKPLQVIRAIGTLFADPETPFLGKSISVVGAKGGVGASTIAHNLAWSIAENARLNTTLIDLDISFGTTALDFNQEGTQSVVDALLAPERTDEAVISRLLTKATDRLSLFTAPATINDELDISQDAYDVVIQAVRRTVPYVVMDLPHIWSTWLSTTLVASDEVMLVCQPDLASLRNGKNIIDRLRAERPNDNPPRLILNMAGVPKRPEIPVKDFAQAIGVEPEVVLPFDPQLFGTAANNGQMISETEPDAKSTMAINHLATLITGQAVNVPKKSFVQKFLGK
ncbi:MAG: AAA family ATPase [Pseudomonadota bacterium]